jgi:Tfp pilus assembly PilM family ATPase
VRSGPLPLGVDLGAARVRVAYAQRDRSGRARLVAVASRDVECRIEDDGDALATIVDELRREIGARTRRAVFALPPSDAVVKILRFPPMSWIERRRAAAFEAERFAPWDCKRERTLVRVHAVDPAERLYAVGAVRESALAARVRLLKRAGLVPAGADHGAYALRRAFPQADAVLDVGLHRFALYGFGPSGPAALDVAGAGERITEAIAAALSIDRTLAERRKRILGTAGAGEEARGELAARASAAIARLREAMPVRRIAMSGNGARLCGLAAEIEAATQALVELPVSELLRDGAYPDDVVRAAAPDWAMAAGLAVWGAGR